MHLLKEEASWITTASFIDHKGIESKGKGLSHIKFLDENHIENTSKVNFGTSEIKNKYRIKKNTELEYYFETINSELGRQSGKFRVHNNKLFSKFSIDNTGLNGYEVIIREGDKCQAYGALYNGFDLINSWDVKMKRL